MWLFSTLVVTMHLRPMHMQIVAESIWLLAHVSCCHRPRCQLSRVLLVLALSEMTKTSRHRRPSRSLLSSMVVDSGLLAVYPRCIGIVHQMMCEAHMVRQLHQHASCVSKHASPGVALLLSEKDHLVNEHPYFVLPSPKCPTVLDAFAFDDSDHC